VIARVVLQIKQQVNEFLVAPEELDFFPQCRVGRGDGPKVVRVFCHWSFESVFICSDDATNTVLVAHHL
jgi:hypothetical protein